MTAVQVYFTPRLYRPDGSGVVYSILLVQVPEGGVLSEESSDQRTSGVPYSHRYFKLIARGRGGGREGVREGGGRRRKRRREERGRE